MGHDLEIFKMYEWIFKNEDSTDERLDGLLVDVLVDVITFWVKTIRFLRRHPLGQSFSKYLNVMLLMNDTSKSG